MAGCDVAVIGGGPAGAAAALALRRHAPHLTVDLLEASDYSGYRAGELLSSSVRVLLAHLGLWTTFGDVGALPSPAVLRVWEHAHPTDAPSLFSARGDGWIVSRATFDRWLADAADAAGAGLRTGRPVASLARRGGGWRLHFADGEALDCHFVIVASGRQWKFARALGAQLLVEDRLVGAVRLFRDPKPSHPGLVIEAVEHGWWYSVPLPDARRVATLMTDADLTDLADPAAWDAALAGTTLVRDLVPERCDPLYVGVHAAASTELSPAGGPGWVAAGDAASGFDPLSAHGVVKAIRSGIFAAYAASDALAGRTSAIERHVRLTSWQADRYRRTRSGTYAEVRRWPTSRFWLRRAVRTESGVS